MDQNPTPEPPQFANYPRPSQGAPIWNGRPPGVYFDAIGDAWRIFQQDAGTWVGASLVVGIIYVILQIPSQVIQFSHLSPATASDGPFGPAASLPPELLLAVIALGLLAGLLHYCMLVSMMRMGSQAALGLPVSLGDIFYGFRRFASYAGAYVTMGFAVGLGSMLCLVPGIYLGGALAFAPLVAISTDLSAIDSIKTTFQAAKPHAWAIFALLFVLGLILIAGVFACGIGVLLTLPIYCIALGIHYNYFFPPVLSGEPAPYEPGFYNQ